jgi:RNA polymerase sigma factor FliA
LPAAVEFPDVELRAPVDDEAALWHACRKGNDGRARTRLIERHIEFARIVAARLYARRFCDEIEFDEYLQMARVALIECVDRYEANGVATFRTYAGHRINGAILSGLEAMTDRARQSALKRRTEQERAQSLRIDGGGPRSDTFGKLASLAVGLAIGFMLDDVGAFRDEDGAYADNAYSALAERQMHRRLRQLAEQLPDREAFIVRSHYFNEVPFEQLATEMRLTKGRVSQLHKRAIETLHAGLRAEALDLST